jgi:hypothetical protein
MYNLVNEDNKIIYNKLCDDMMGNILSYLDDEEKIEWCHIRKMNKYVTKYYSNMVVMVCTKCNHNPKFCICKKRKMCLAKLAMIGVVIILIVPFVLAILNYHTII